MAALLTAATSNSNPASATGTASGATSVLIEIPGDSVFDGAEVTIEGSSVNTATKFCPIARLAKFQSPGTVVLSCPTGHFFRALLNRAGASTSVTVNMLDIA